MAYYEFKAAPKATNFIGISKCTKALTAQTRRLRIVHKCT